jgi:hypothetical protein
MCRELHEPLMPEPIASHNRNVIGSITFFIHRVIHSAQRPGRVDKREEPCFQVHPRAKRLDRDAPPVDNKMDSKDYEEACLKCYLNGLICTSVQRASSRGRHMDAAQRFRAVAAAARNTSDPR